MVVHHRIPPPPAHGYDKVHECDPFIPCYSSQDVQQYPEVVQQYGKKEEKIPHTHFGGDTGEAVAPRILSGDRVNMNSDTFSFMSSFRFMLSPLKIRGATASPVSPLAIF